MSGMDRPKPLVRAQPQEPVDPGSLVDGSPDATFAITGSYTAAMNGAGRVMTNL
jgi:hypothetical protein